MPDADGEVDTEQQRTATSCRSPSGGLLDDDCGEASAMRASGASRTDGTDLTSAPPRQLLDLLANCAAISAACVFLSRLLAQVLRLLNGLGTTCCAPAARRRSWLVAVYSRNIPTVSAPSYTDHPSASLT